MNTAYKFGINYNLIKSFGFIHSNKRNVFFIIVIFFFLFFYLFFFKRACLFEHVVKYIHVEEFNV